MHPCLACGACCAHYRVAFHWLETDAAAPTGVPVALTEPLDPHRVVMRGTRAHPTRCAALAAIIGQQARCTIHPQRPSVCRDVPASWENGTPSPQCDRARQAHGLVVLTAADWPAPPAAMPRPAANTSITDDHAWPDDSAPAA
ncbi:YkgJ family cysteine cluster protein [Salinisphaera sp. Q1T1-3]|uniref:YkgJ family cysteine cluster protein n=1 Tax=Salinisphaera sp. Q1T1-3 TaxID=2321229 RepID=UPI000E75BD5E|nr:YkgJ family cysteine cluster protein [Salinisphaera sp. Q1T1-3]RJS93383.1 YkgJ family cysteine cluster protein [Salinisphaera sp. Q1T1-3]